MCMGGVGAGEVGWCLAISLHVIILILFDKKHIYTVTSSEDITTEQKKMHSAQEKQISMLQ